MTNSEKLSKTPAGDTLEIAERSSGYWVTDGSGLTEGPFVELDDAIAFKIKQERIHAK